MKRNVWKPAQNAGWIAHTPFKMRHSPETWSELFQERQQFVIWSIAFGRAFDRAGFCQSLLLQCEIGIEIDLSGLNRLVAKPERNNCSIYASL